MFDDTEYKNAMESAVVRFQDELKKSALVALILICSPMLRLKLMGNSCR